MHVGVGVRGQHWLDIVRDYPDAVSVGCVDPVPAALEKVLRTRPDVQCFNNLGEALKRVEADAAIIASPIPLHRENALQCLDAGLATMVEKPFAATVREAYEVVKRGEALGRPTMAAQNYRFNPAERTLRHLVQQDYLGKITSAQCIACRYRAGKGNFLGSMEYAQIVEDAVHHLDSLRSILGQNPVSMVGRAFNPPWSEYLHGAATQALIEMEGGVHVQYVGTLASHRYGLTFWIEGENGVLWTNRKWVLGRQRGKRLFWPIRTVRVPKGDGAPYPRQGTTSLLNNLRDAIRQKRQPETSGRDNLWTLAMLEAGMRSDRQKREIRIEEILNEADASCSLV